MRASIVIPVWNGVDVIAGCLDAVHTHSSEWVAEVVCVDNASVDGSAERIEEAYPWVRLIRQPVNLGFAGGVNHGIEAARTSESPSDDDLFVLLNQDCIVHAGWLEALRAAFTSSPALGIAGCTILKADGSIDHTGAQVRRPDAAGIHLVGASEGGWMPADYVTGAAMAICRATWQIVGRFDEGFYPAYYEDADYCYRARRRGIEVGYVPGARVTHLRSSKAWEKDPFAHAVNHHRARYRFAGKHFDSEEIAGFATAEARALEEEGYLDQAVARAIAARDSVRALPDVMARRRADLGEPPSAVQRQMAVALRDIRRLALVAARRLVDTGLEEPPIEAWRQRSRALRQELEKTRASLHAGPASAGQERSDSSPSTGETSSVDTLAAVQDRQNELLARIHFHPSEAGSERAWWRRFRHTVLRLASVLTGHEDVLQTRLHALSVKQLDLMTRQVDALNAQIDLLHLLLDEREQQSDWQLDYHIERLERRLDLLQALVEHD